MPNIILPVEGQPSLPPCRDKSLIIEQVTQRGTGTVYLRPYLRVTAETKRGYRRLMAYITKCGTRSQMCLATADKRDYDRVLQRLRDLAELMGEYESLGYSYMPFEESISRTVDTFPIEQWLWVMMRGYEGGGSYFDGLGDQVFDDGRKLTLDPMSESQTQRMEIWPGLRVIFEDCFKFRRLSILVYHSKTKSTSRVLSTSDSPDMTRAQAVIAIALDEYKASGRKIPNELVDRLPTDQWFSMLTAGLETDKVNQESSYPESLLTIQPTKGKSTMDSQARWTISPSVVISFQERFDRPALYLHERASSHSPKMTHERLSSVPITDVESIRERLRDAVERHLWNHRVDFGGMGTPLITQQEVLVDGDLDYKRLDEAIDALPLPGMLAFYDQAILPMRLNGHRKRMYPNCDYDMRWISKAGPETHTASEDCWWVQVGITRTGKGAVFPFRGNAEAALLEAKAWRNETERALDIAPLSQTEEVC